MSASLVQAVFFARYTQSNFRALYGRLSTKTDSTYSKDYLQIPEEPGTILAKVFGTSKDPIDIDLKWLGGNKAGKFHWSADRWHLAWPTNAPPAPWTIGDPQVDPAISISGNRTLTTPELADAEFARLEKAGIRPWLLAVKLTDEKQVLHLRVYFENPPTKFADRGLDKLPEELRAVIKGLSGASGAGALDLSEYKRLAPPPSSLRAAKLVTRIQEALQREANVLLVGPPGTGKTVALEDLRSLYAEQYTTGSILFDPDVWGPAWSRVGPETDARSESLVFHPSYTYENFVAGLVPTTTTSGGMELHAKPGPFLSLANWVGTSERRAILILDEFNRAPAAAIFGDTLSLLDMDKRSSSSKAGASIQRPFLGYKMEVSESYAAVDGSREIPTLVRLPANVAIVAAMNSTDRSVAPLDAALRRRFMVLRVEPDYDALALSLGLSSAGVQAAKLPASDDIAHWTRDDVAVLGIKVLVALNERIEVCLGEDFLLGHALLWKLPGATTIALLEEISIALDTKAVPTLRTTFLDQDDVLAAVLSVPDSAAVEFRVQAPQDRVAYWRYPPASLANFNARRLVTNRLQDMTAENELKAIRALLGT